MFENSILNEVLNLESSMDLITTVDVEKDIAENFFNVSIRNSIGNLSRIKLDYLGIEVLIYVASLYDDMVELKLLLRNTNNKHTNIGKRIHLGETEVDVEELLIRVKLIAGITFLMLIPSSSFSGYHENGSDIVYGKELFNYKAGDLFGSYPKLITNFDIKSMEGMFDYLWFNFPQDLTSKDAIIKKITLEEMI